MSLPPMVAVNWMVLRSPGARLAMVWEVPLTLLFSRTRMFLISTLPALYSSYCTLTVLSRRTTSGSMVRLTVRSTWVPV